MIVNEEEKPIIKFIYEKFAETRIVFHGDGFVKQQRLQNQNKVSQ